MELDELEARLGPFARAKYGEPGALVGEVHKILGHAGFAYDFTVESRGARESWFLRIAPPNVAAVNRPAPLARGSRARPP